MGFKIVEMGGVCETEMCFLSVARTEVPQVQVKLEKVEVKLEHAGVKLERITVPVSDRFVV